MFEQLRQRFSIEAKARKEPPEIITLTSEMVTGLNMGWNSHFSPEMLREHLKEFPLYSLRVAGANEYIVGDTWRKRPDVGQIIETKAGIHRADLVEALVKEYLQRGFGAVVLGNDEQATYSRFYKELGFTELERIVYYEKPNMLLDFDYKGEQIRCAPFTPALMGDLLRVDNAAFPWLWWNGIEELAFYTAQPDVYVTLAYSVNSGEAVGYFGYTIYEQWGHLDRLAVLPELQGKFVGAYLLANSIEGMAERGAKRVTLSTQLTNYQSQRLYEGFGFQRVRNLEYSLIGKILK